MRILEIEDHLIEIIKITSNALIFDGGRGVKLSKLRNTYNTDLSEVLNGLRSIFNFLGVELRESDDRIFLSPSHGTYLNMVEMGFSNDIPKLSRNNRKILLRFISLYLSQGTSEPISVHKLEHEMKESFNIDLRKKNLEDLHRIGYVNFIRRKFVDIGWRLKGSRELREFEENLIKIFEEAFNLNYELTGSEEGSNND